MIAAARAELHRLLQQDPAFMADMAALTLSSASAAATPRVIKGNRRFEQIGQENYPCWISEKGDARGGTAGNDGGDSAGLVIGSGQQDWQADLELSLVWHQQDFARAVDQRDGVGEALVRLLLRNPDLGDTCTFAFVANEINDRAFRAPTHWVAFVVRVLHTIHRDT